MQGTGHEKHLLAVLQDQGAGWVIMEASGGTKRQVGLGGNGSIPPTVEEPISALDVVRQRSGLQGNHVCLTPRHGGGIKCHHILLVACTQGISSALCNS